MCTENGNILSIVTFQGIQVFTVSGDGVFAVHHLRNLVPEGTLDTGEIIYGLNEDKIGLYGDVTHMEAHTGGTHFMEVSVEGGDFVSLGEHEEHTQPFVLGEARARIFELRLGLTRDTVDPTMAQILTSWLLRVQVVPSISEVWTVPLLISDSVHDLDGNPHPMDPFIVLSYIRNLTKQKEIVQFIVNGVGFPVVVEDYDLPISSLINDKQAVRGFNGTCNVLLKDISEAV